MLRFFVTLIVLTFITLTGFAASYKINTSGQITSPNGNIQQTKPLSYSSNYVNNYYIQPYTNNPQINNTSTQIIDIVIDYSGSMQPWINEAKNAITKVVSQLPSNVQVGLRVFGHNNGANPYNATSAMSTSINKKTSNNYKISLKLPSHLGNTSGMCSATSQITKILPNNANNIYIGMNSVSIGYATPLTLALDRAVYSDFANFPQSIPKKIIIVTDGGETCNGSPCGFVKNLIKSRQDIVIDVVMVSSLSKALKCLTTSTGGEFYTVANIESLKNTIYNTIEKPINTPAIKQQQYEFIKN